jgi:hypothetical protein
MLGRGGGEVVVVLAVRVIGVRREEGSGDGGLGAGVTTVAPAVASAVAPKMVIITILL